MTSPAFDTNGIRWSPQQTAVFAATRARKSIMLIAVAGAGKSTTLKEICRITTGSVGVCMYNKSTQVDFAADLYEKYGVDKKRVRVGTFHSFGFNAWTRVVGAASKRKEFVDDQKVPKLCTELKVPEELHQFVTKAVSLAKQRALGVLCSFDDHAAWLDIVAHFDLSDTLPESVNLADETVVDEKVQEGLVWAKQVLKLSIERDMTVIDYDDMIFAPLVHKVRMWQNDTVLIDEAQDTNPARRALAKKMLRPGGQLIAVGDPHQAIYGFTGADNDALDVIEREFGCTRMPLTVTFRCPKAVVTVARQWVSHIEAAPTAPEGRVEVMPEVAFNRLPKEELTAADVVLCRNTKPLVTLAYSLIRRGIGCHVEGRDIGRGLMALARHWEVRNCEALLDKLEEYTERETQKLLAKGQEVKAEQLQDKVDTLRVIIDSVGLGATINELAKAIDLLFGDVKPGEASKNLTLSTVHKAKGREWNRVYLLGRNAYMPSRYARQDWQKEQEINLMYVAVTRAKQTLVEVPVAGIAKQ